MELEMSVLGAPGGHVQGQRLGFAGFGFGLVKV